MLEDKEKGYIHFRNSDVKSITAGVPEGHMHLRTIIETDGGNFVFQEATVAALVRAYTSIKTHPQKKAVKLTGQMIADRKKGYAAYQLLETDDDSRKIAGEIAGIMDY